MLHCHQFLKIQHHAAIPCNQSNFPLQRLRCADGRRQVVTHGAAFILLMIRLPGRGNSHLENMSRDAAVPQHNDAVLRKKLLKLPHKEIGVDRFALIELFEINRKALFQSVAVIQPSAGVGEGNVRSLKQRLDRLRDICADGNINPEGGLLSSLGSTSITILREFGENASKLKPIWRKAIRQPMPMTRSAFWTMKLPARPPLTPKFP